MSVRIEPFVSRSLSNGFLPPWKTSVDWLQSRRESLIEEWNISEAHKESMLDRILVGSEKTSLVAVWFGDVLDEQLFALLVISSLAELVNPPNLLLCNCGEGGLSIRGMQGMLPQNLQNVEPILASAEDCVRARTMWTLVTSTDHSSLNEMAASSKHWSLTSTLHTLLTRFPSSENGLDCWEDWILRRIVNSKTTVAKVISDCITEGQLNSNDSINDTELLRCIVGLTQEKLAVPLIRLEKGDSIMNAFVTISDAGRAIVEGQLHQLRINDIEKTIGGITVSRANPCVFDGINIGLLQDEE